MDCRVSPLRTVWDTVCWRPFLPLRSLLARLLRSLPRSLRLLGLLSAWRLAAANRHADNKPNSRNERGNERNNRASNDRNGRNGRQQTVSHTVRSGDTLQSIARRYNTSVADIKRSNNLGNSVLRPGQKLRVSSGT